MPTVNNAFSEFERFLTRARAGRDALAREREALLSEAVRIHGEVSDRFSAAVAGRFTDAGALLKLDAAQGNPLRLSARLATLGREADRAKEALWAHRARTVDGPSPEEVSKAEETRTVARFAWDDAARAKDGADRVLRQFDARFLRAHGIVEHTGVDEAVLKAPPFLARTFDAKVRAALKALTTFEGTVGSSYWTVRDAEYRPAVARQDAVTAVERAAWSSLEAADGVTSALRRRRAEADEHAAEALVLDRASSAAAERLRSPMGDLSVHAGVGMKALLDGMTEEALRGKPGRASSVLEYLASEGLIGSGDLARAGHAVSLRKAADALNKPIRDMDSLASKLSQGKDKLGSAKRKGAGSKHVSIDLSSIEKAVKAGGGKIDSVLGDLGRIRTPDHAGAVARRGEDAPYQATTDAMLLFWIIQVAGMPSQVPTGNFAPHSLDDASLSGLGAAHAVATTGTDFANVSLDVASFNVDIPTISVDIPAISVDIPTITVDVPSFSVDTNF